MQDVVGEGETGNETPVAVRRRNVQFVHMRLRTAPLEQLAQGRVTPGDVTVAARQVSKRRVGVLDVGAEARERSIDIEALERA